MIDENFLKKFNALLASGKAADLDYDDVAARVLVDQLVTCGALDDEEAAQFETLAAIALPGVSDVTACRLAQTLAPLPHTPISMLNHLIAISPQTAAIIFTRAPNLPADLLRARADRGGGVEEAIAIAGRADLDAETIAALARRPEIEVLQAIACNMTARLERGALLYLTQRGRLDRALGEAVLARADIDYDLTPLFLWANAPQRKMMIVAAKRAALGAPAAFCAPLEAMREEALAALRKGGRSAFIAVVARRYAIHRTMAEAVINDAGGEPLGLLLAGMGLSEQAASDVLHLLRPDFLSADSDFAKDGLTEILNQAPEAASGFLLALRASPVCAAHILTALLGGKRPPLKQNFDGARRFAETGLEKSDAKSLRTQAPSLAKARA